MVGMSLPQTHALFVSLSVTNILLCIGLLLLFHKPYDTAFIAKAFAIAVAGFLVEVVGVKTGKLFGIYQYTDVLGWRLFDVPLLIGLNWFFMVYCSVQLAKLFKLPLILTALLSGLFMVTYDIALEPNAIALNYWQWQGNTVPLQNYVAWFGFGSLFSYLFLLKSNVVENNMAKYLYFLQVTFFCVLLLT
jgi:uncharacterized membrane protein